MKTKSDEQIDQYDIEVLPKLVYFEAEIPTFWPDSEALDNNQTILAWVETCQVETHKIQQYIIYDRNSIFYNRFMKYIYTDMQTHRDK